MTTASELYERVADILDATRLFGDADDRQWRGIYRTLYELLVLVCDEGTRGERQAFGSTFAKVDYLCKKCGMAAADMYAVQTMRRHANRPGEALADAEAKGANTETKGAAVEAKAQTLGYDLRALCLFISAVLGEGVPATLTSRLPHGARRPTSPRVNLRCLRCIVRSADSQTITAETGHETITVDYRTKADAEGRLLKMVREGVQLNLLDCHREGSVVTPSLIVVEPDFLVDISAIAACFTPLGHHPLSYTVNRLRPAAHSQAILMGAFASQALDDIINTPEGQAFDSDASLRRFLQEHATELATIGDLDLPAFSREARRQAANVEAAAHVLFRDFDRTKMMLEPTFVCERLGLQGRVDLMTADFRLLVEQKSGKNYHIERQCNNQYGNRYQEQHYVQVLLYFGVLWQNFGVDAARTSIRLLYSKFPPEQGLLAVANYQTLFREALMLRNKIVATEYFLADKGIEPLLPHLRAETLNETHNHQLFAVQYLLPQIEEVVRPLHTMGPVERAYFCRMVRFVCKEQLLSKVGAGQAQSAAVSDLWNMPLAEKVETGNIVYGLHADRPTTDDDGNTLVRLTVAGRAVAGQTETDPMSPPNFRVGDSVYLYHYADPEPDVRHSILRRGQLIGVGDTEMTVMLSDPLSSLPSYPLAIEHSSSDIGFTSALRGLRQLLVAPDDRRRLLTGQRQPRTDVHRRLHSRHGDALDDVVEKAMQARDFYLLSGPPGTGKTSCAIRRIVEEELCHDGTTVLLMAYTNRAVDELCDMLETAGIDYVRLGRKYSCDGRFRPRLRWSDRARVVTATTSHLAAHPEVFAVRTFSLAVVDEASQILEPNIIGLLAMTRGDGRDAVAAIGRFILVGDHKQLPAVVRQDEQEAAVDHPLLNAMGLRSCRDSLFERMLRHQRMLAPRHAGTTLAAEAGDVTGILRRQGRMHPDIAAFPNSHFYRREQLLPVPLPHQEETSERPRVLFIPVTPDRSTLSEKTNAGEAAVVAQVVRRLCTPGDAYHACLPDDGKDGRSLPWYDRIGIIVPYRNQIAMIRHHLERSGLPQADRVCIDTVERYQGSQRDVIIYSFTISRLYQLDFLTANTFESDGALVDRKLNVAMTRARRLLVMTGNERVLAHSPVFAELIDYVRATGGYGGIDNGQKTDGTPRDGGTVTKE